MTDDLWESHASWWQAEFTGGVDAEYTEQIEPMAAERLVGARRVLDIGAGEGQLARLAISGGAGFVVGVDPTSAQITEAVVRAGGPVYGEADAADLPFADASFDAVLACLVFEHIQAVDSALAEVARVLEPGGTFLFFLNHPLLQTPGSGLIEDWLVDPPETYWRIGPYLHETEVIEEVQKDVFIPFVHRPLSRYVNAALRTGMQLVEMQEPAPPEGFLAQSDQYQQASAIPRLLMLRFVRPDASERRVR